jgi:hypothetical protein
MRLHDLSHATCVAQVNAVVRACQRPTASKDPWEVNFEFFGALPSLIAPRAKFSAEKVESELAEKYLFSHFEGTGQSSQL